MYIHVHMCIHMHTCTPPAHLSGTAHQYSCSYSTNLLKALSVDYPTGQHEDRFARGTCVLIRSGHLISVRPLNWLSSVQTALRWSHGGGRGQGAAVIGLIRVTVLTLDVYRRTDFGSRLLHLNHNKPALVLGAS